MATGKKRKKQILSTYQKLEKYYRTTLQKIFGEKQGKNVLRVKKNFQDISRVWQVTPIWIGARLRKLHWDACSMTVLDVGSRFIVGQMYDHNDKKVVGLELFPRDDDDFYLYVDAKKLIKNIPVREKEGK